MALSMDGPNCRVGADNVPKPRRLELVSGDSVTNYVYSFSHITSFKFYSGKAAELSVSQLSSVL
jgi:hypothetical protein